MGANNILRPDKSKMLDTVAHYVERIVQSGNELIDIVVPYQPATEDDKEPLKDKLTELLCDIWDNFVYMTGDTRRIVLLAAGFGCYSMISFMNERQKDVARYVSCAVVIPGGDEAVPMVTKRLANWYMEHSFVVVADDHPVWERVNQKMSNRTGNIVRSGKNYRPFHMSRGAFHSKIWNSLTNMCFLILFHCFRSTIGEIVRVSSTTVQHTFLGNRTADQGPSSIGPTKLHAGSSRTPKQRQQQQQRSQ